MNRWMREAGVLLLVAVVAAGWHYRARLMALVNPPVSAARPAEVPDVLYTWVDKDGVTHFSAQPGKGGTRVEYDGSRITPMAPVEAPLAASLPDPGAATNADGRKGSDLIYAMRDDIKQNRDKIEKAKRAATGLDQIDQE